MKFEEHIQETILRFQEIGENVGLSNFMDNYVKKDFRFLWEALAAYYRTQELQKEKEKLPKLLRK